MPEAEEAEEVRRTIKNGVAEADPEVEPVILQLVLQYLVQIPVMAVNLHLPEVQLHRIPSHLGIHGALAAEELGDGVHVMAIGLTGVAQVAVATELVVHSMLEMEVRRHTVVAGAVLGAVSVSVMPTASIMDSVVRLDSYMVL